MMLAIYVVDVETRCRNGRVPVCGQGARQKPLARSDVKGRRTRNTAPASSRAFARLLADLSASWRVPAGA
jgi:hypothetical protein